MFILNENSVELNEAISYNKWLLNKNFKFIINPEANLELAKKLEPIIENCPLQYNKMVRDYCLPINEDIEDALKKAGYTPKLINGFFIVDNANLADKHDLATLGKFNSWKYSGKSIPEFIVDNNYCGKDKRWFTYIPHYWLELDGLIIDRAWPMFIKALESPLTKERYSHKDFNESLCEDITLDNEVINSPQALMTWMNNNIAYHLEVQDYNEDNPEERLTQTTQELIKSKNGHCAEQAYLEKYVLDQLGYKTQLVFVKENSSKNDYGYDGNAHVFLVYKDNDKYCWFEHAMEHMRGIHKYDSLNELLSDVAKNWWRYNDPEKEELADKLEIRFIDKPITGVNNLELAKQCYKYPVIKTFDISKNRLEESYDPPYNAQQIKDNYGVELYNKLANDPTHKFRMDTGIELIHKEPTLKELNRIWNNWQQMTPKQKAISDKKSIELFGLDNKTNYEKLVGTYNIKKSVLNEVYSDKDNIIIAYHGSPNKFSKFDLNKSNPKNNIIGKGIYLLDKKDLDVMPYITNSEINYLYTCEANLGKTYTLKENEVADYARLIDQGYDSITDNWCKVGYEDFITGKKEDNRSFTQYLIFDPNNVKIIKCEPYNKVNESLLTEVYPNKSESKKDFIARFMSVTKDEYPDTKQRFAVCMSYWDRRKKHLKEEFKEIETRPFELEDLLYWYNPDEGTCNAIIDYKSKKTRVRAGLLVIKDNQILLCKDGNKFDIPGGSIEIGETVSEAAKRETQEEVHVTAKNIEETGFDYCTVNDELEPWVAENVPIKYQWYNYYTCLCIGKYDKEYRGHIDTIDQDPKMNKSAEWYNIDSVIDNPDFLEPWKNALKKFGYLDKKLIEALPEATESDLSASKARIEALLGIPYEEALELVKEDILAICADNYINIKINDIDFTGSQRFGKPGKDSDLDVAFSYSDIDEDIREDDLFNILNEEPLYLEGYQLDINPLKDEDLGWYIDNASKYKKESLHEDTRNTLINKSRSAGAYKDTTRGKNRFERKRLSRVSNTVKEFNQINMDEFFKKDLLTINIPVIGETDSYKVAIRLDGVLKEIANNIKSNGNKFEYKIVLQALTKIFNTTNVYVNCTCADYKYRFDHWNIINNVSTSDSAHDPGPGKGVANPNDDKGRGCKHILLVLNNLVWINNAASVIKNYINWIDEHEPKLFAKLIFPKLYGMSEEDAVDKGLLPEDTKLATDKDIIDKINEWAKNRGKYQPGSNKNPVTGTGGKTKKEEKPVEETK